MTKQQKITLSASRDIPFNKLMLSQSNVRHVKAGVSIEELAEDIARRTLLSSITVRPVLDDSGAETGMYTIPAGGRRFRALELLVKQKRMNKTALVNRPGFTGGQNSRRIACYGTESKEDLEAVFTRVPRTRGAACRGASWRISKRCSGACCDRQQIGLRAR
jgi:hypothetical protein